MFVICLRITYLNTFIRIFYTVIVLYLSEIYLFIYSICLFYLFIPFITLFIYLLEGRKIEENRERRKIEREGLEEFPKRKFISYTY